MIKLKNLILEWDDEYGPRKPTISRQEEHFCLQLILNRLVPPIVKIFNEKIERYGAAPIDEATARRSLKKLKVENHTNGQEILYMIQLPKEHEKIGIELLFKTQKLAFRKDTGDNKNQNVYRVGYWDFKADGWGDLRWFMINVEEMIKPSTNIADTD